MGRASRVSRGAARSVAGLLSNRLRSTPCRLPPYGPPQGTTAVLLDLGQPLTEPVGSVSRDLDSMRRLTDRRTRSKSRSLLDPASKASLVTFAWFSHARVPVRLRHHGVFPSKSLGVVFVLTDTTTSRVFSHWIHLKPFLGLEYVELRDCAVFRFALTQPDCGGGEQDAGQGGLVGQWDMNIIGGDTDCIQRNHGTTAKALRIQITQRPALEGQEFLERNATCCRYRLQQTPCCTLFRVKQFPYFHQPVRNAKRLGNDYILAALLTIRLVQAVHARTAREVVDGYTQVAWLSPCVGDATGQRCLCCATIIRRVQCQEEDISLVTFPLEEFCQAAPVRFSSQWVGELCGQELCLWLVLGVSFGQYVALEIA